MKIIKKGDPGKKLPWVNKTITCRDCGCKFKLELADSAKVKFVSDQRDGDFYQVNCPECKAQQTITTR